MFYFFLQKCWIVKCWIVKLIVISQPFHYYIWLCIFLKLWKRWAASTFSRKLSWNQWYRPSLFSWRTACTWLCACIYSNESVWDFEFGISIGIFRPKYRVIGIGFGIEIGMKSVWIRYEISIGIGIKLALIWNLTQFHPCSCEYNIAIEHKIGRKSVSNDLEPIPKLK